MHVHYLVTQFCWQRSKSDLGAFHCNVVNQTDKTMKFLSVHDPLLQHWKIYLSSAQDFFAALYRQMTQAEL